MYNEAMILERLVKLRKDAGFTQKAVESRLALRTGTIYDYEKGRLKLSLELAYNLCELYGVSLQGILDGQTLDFDRDSKIPHLIQLSFITNPNRNIMQLAMQDPIIIAEIGLDVPDDQLLLEHLLKSLSEKQRRDYIVEIYKYMNSLIGCDRIITEIELSLRNTFLEHAPVEFSEKELSTIKKSFASKYLGKTSEKYFPREAFKHFLIWALYAVGLCDGELNYSEKTYIEEVAQNIALKISSLEFIYEKVLQFNRPV